MVDPHRQQTLPPDPAEPNIKQWFRNIRRHRHARDTSTAQAETQIFQTLEASNYRYARADTEVRPYAEFSSKCLCVVRIERKYIFQTLEANTYRYARADTAVRPYAEVVF